MGVVISVKNVSNDNSNCLSCLFNCRSYLSNLDGSFLLLKYCIYICSFSDSIILCFLMVNISLSLYIEAEQLRKASESDQYQVLITDVSYRSEANLLYVSKNNLTFDHYCLLKHQRLLFPRFQTKFNPVNSLLDLKKP